MQICLAYSDRRIKLYDTEAEIKKTYEFQIRPELFLILFCSTHFSGTTQIGQTMMEMHS